MHQVSRVLGRDGLDAIVPHVEAFENAVKLSPAPWFALIEEFGAQGVAPEGQMSKDDAVYEVVRGIAELVESSDESYVRG